MYIYIIIIIMYIWNLLAYRFLHMHNLKQYYFEYDKMEWGEGRNDICNECGAMRHGNGSAITWEWGCNDMRMKMRVLFQMVLQENSSLLQMLFLDHPVAPS